MDTIEDIYKLWPTAAAFARAIDVPAVTARQWRNRGYRIPSRYWPEIQKAARAQGSEVALEIFLADTAFQSRDNDGGGSRRSVNERPVA